MSATGKNTQSSTTSSFISALVVAGITVGAFSALWLAFHGRRNLKRVYQARTELAPPSKRPPELPSGLVAFWRTVFKTPDTEIIVANGVDAYLFTRFLRVFGIEMLLPYFLLTFIILIPVSAASPNAGLTGLNKLTFGNVAQNHQARHVAHFLVALILMAWTVYLVWREYNHFVVIRQAWLASPQHLTLARTRTIAITNLPDSINSESGLRELAQSIGRITGGNVSQSQARFSTNTDRSELAVGADGESELGGLRQIWLTKKVKEVEKVWEERDKECLRLEGGVGKLIKLGLKNERKGKTPEKLGKLDTERAGAEMVDRFVLPEKRPSWKQGLLGLIGKKQTLESSPVYIKEHNQQLEQMRGKASELPQGNTAFLRFASQHEAHAFARLVSSTDKQNRLIDSGIEVIPEDVQWSNISMNPYQRKVRIAISWALTIGLIIIWAVPVAFVGLVSNVDTLCETAPWLAWICRLPSPALGIIKGVLPPVLLAVLFMLLPIVLRLWIRLQGEIRRSDIELKLFSRFWLFQVIHGFLIVTLASGLVKALGNGVGTAANAPTLLAENLPGASIFFLTFILTATFSAAAKNYSRLMPFIMWQLRGILGGNTPRKVYIKEFKMQSYMWATTWPPLCLIVCLTIVYSVIQPVITILALVGLGLTYAGYKYILYWNADQPDSLETGGMFYIRALRTVFVSLYIEGIFLAALFFLTTDQNGNRTPSGLGCGVIMAIGVACIAVFQTWIDWFRFRKDYLIYAHSTTALTATASRLPFAHKLSGGANAVGDGRNGAGLKPVPTSASQEDDAAGEEHGNTTGFHEHAFDHPALWKQQSVVWIADDPLGIGKFETERINRAGVEASTEHAHQDEKGGIYVDRAPPDEAWYGGFSAH